MLCPHPTADVFCKVVDNFGDAAIGWRLARALARDHGFTVRLFIDDRATLARLKPALDPAAATQTLEDVTVLPDTDALGAAPADLIIETLAAEVPETYLHAMAACDPKPVWMLYEYLSAEAWVAGTHLKPSPHPRLPLTKFFFYPGFTPQTGGLLAESFIKIAEPTPIPAKIFLFGYENDAVLTEFLQKLAQTTAPTTVFVPEGRSLTSIQAISAPKGPVTIQNLPFIDQDALTQSLATYDLNIIRGEDSLTLAVLTGRPVIWHIYPQDDDAHIVKLRAFLALYTADLSASAANAVIAINLAWNGVGDVGPAWDAYLAHFPEISAAAAGFARKMHENGAASQKLVDFYRQKG